MPARPLQLQDIYEEIKLCNPYIQLLLFRRKNIAQNTSVENLFLRLWHVASVFAGVITAVVSTDGAALRLEGREE